MTGRGGVGIVVSGNLVKTDSELKSHRDSALTLFFSSHTAMNVGVCKIRLRLPGNLSLKGKRQVIKSITTRVASKFNVSIAEVDDNDRWQVATLGISLVSNDNRYTNEVLSKIVDFIVGSRFDIEVLGYDIEILSV